MKEEQNRLNIEKQEAKRDIYNIGYQKAEVIYNVAGDLHPITQEPVYIPSIQSVLRKGETTEGDFFKKEPEWVDYEQGFIVERKEVDEIIKKLENNKVQLILGAPASGKSIILKNVGYKLANDGKKVYDVELKKHPQDEIKFFFENISKIDEDNPIFIVDDAHLYLSDCERLIRNFRSNGKGKLIIGSRETREITEEHPKDGAEYELLSELSKTCIHIQAEDVTEGLIRNFLKKQYHFDKDKIKIVSSNFNKYKKDLWFLSWALKAYNKEKDSVDIDEIYEKITSSIEKIKVGKGKEPINAEDVFLPLSIFYRFEIPIERYFLEEQLGIDEKIINQLIGLQEIIENENPGKHKMLSLIHSSIGKLYFGAYLRYPDLGRRIKKTILNEKGYEELEYCSFYQYITTTDSRSAVDVSISLDRDFSDKKGKITLQNLIKEDKIQKSIKNGIDKEEDIGKVGRCVLGIAQLSQAMKPVAMKLANSIDIYALSSKINKEEDIEKVGRCVHGIGWASGEVAVKLANSIDINALSSKIKKEDDIEKVGRCIHGIAWANKEGAMKLMDIVSAKIDKENDIWKIMMCVDNISEGRKELAIELVKNIDIDALSSKIYKEEDIGKVGSCFLIIERESKEAAMKLVDIVSTRINKEDDIGMVGWVAGIADKEVANEIINRLNPKLREELPQRIHF